MVRLCDGDSIRQDFLACISNTAMGCRMETDLRAYGDIDPQTNAWTVYSENQAACGGILASAGSLFVCLNRVEGVFDCAQFLHFLFSGSRVHCDGKTAEWLAPYGYAEAESGDILLLDKPPDIPAARQGYQKPEEIRLSELYELLCACFDSFREQQEKDAFVSDVYLKRKQGASILGLCQQGKLCATACIYAVGETSALLSAVATLPEHRGRGLAGYLVKKICRELVLQGKRVFVMTEHEILTRFYQKLGFTKCGRWVVLEETKNE